MMLTSSATLSSGTAQLGPIGETIAAVYLSRRGYRVLDRNVRTRRGEIDLVALRGDELVFVEVKSWRRVPLEGLEHAVNRRKQHRIISVARAYAARNPQRCRGLRQRFDVILIRDGVVVHHVEGAFEG
jgi:putative endonuclease